MSASVFEFPILLAPAADGSATRTGSASDSVPKRRYKYLAHTFYKCGSPEDARVSDLENTVLDTIHELALLLEIDKNSEMEAFIYEARKSLRPEADDDGFVSERRWKEACSVVDEGYLEENGLLLPSDYELANVNEPKNIVAVFITVPARVSIRSEDYFGNEQVQKAYDRLWIAREDSTTNRDGVAYLRRDVFNQTDIVMVRDEYRELWAHILKGVEEAKSKPSTRVGALVVTGQPGIGKSFFLYYALAEALKARIPVAYCDNEAFGFTLCDDRGCRSYPVSADPAVVARGTLVLVDSNEQMPSPPRIFTGTSMSSYLVQATSPQTSRWRQWAKERRAHAWIMGLWSRDICETLMIDVWSGPPAAYSPVELFDLVGPSARICFGDAIPKTGDYAADISNVLRPEHVLQDLDAFVQVMADGTLSSSNLGYGFRTFFFATNRYGSNPVRTPAFDLYIPTSFLRELLAPHYIRRESAVQLRLASQFSFFPQVATALYESLVLHFLQQAKTVHKGYVYDDEHGSSEFTLGPDFRLCLRAVDVAAPSSFTPVDNHIYVPPAGYPSLNAFVVSKNRTRVTLLQMTVTRKHTIAVSGVRDIIKLLNHAGLTTSTCRFTFLFVTPRERGESMARNNKTAFHKRFRNVGLGWLQLGDPDDLVTTVLNKLLQEDGSDVEIIDDVTEDEDGERVVKRLRLDDPTPAAGSSNTD